jgi:tetratricopeptide (TPR) repeat protein
MTAPTRARPAASTPGWSAAVRKAIAAKKPQAVRTVACEAQDGGDYRAALLGIAWFHRNALRYDEALSGVRLSFALGDWVRLAEVYEPARALFEDTLHRGTERLLAGRGSWSLFADVTSMYEYLDQSHRVVELFRAVEANFPKRALDYFAIVRDLLVEEGDYARCFRYLNPARQLEGDIEFLATQLNLAHRFLVDGVGVHFDPFEKFADRVGVLLEILWGSGHRGEAREIHQRALAQVGTVGVQRALTMAQRRANKRRKTPPPVRSPRQSARTS